MIEALHIRNASMKQLNLSDSLWKKWKNLKYLTVTNGRIDQVVGSLPKNAGITCLNFSSNLIQDFVGSPFSDLSNLNYLDVSRNSLTLVPTLTEERNISLDISGRL